MFLLDGGGRLDSLLGQFIALKEIPIPTRYEAKCASWRLKKVQL
jgi:hypothetical protein